MANFIQVLRQEYNHGCYAEYETIINVDDISRVLSCTDDICCSNVVMKDGKIITIQKRLSELYKLISEANNK